MINNFPYKIDKLEDNVKNKYYIIIYRKNTLENEIRIDFNENHVLINIAENSVEIQIPGTYDTNNSTYKLSFYKIEIELVNFIKVITDQIENIFINPYTGTRDWTKKIEIEDDKNFNEDMHTWYENADDDTKRAMQKSMEESGGTVLNMNWNEVKDKRITLKRSDESEDDD